MHLMYEMTLTDSTCSISDLVNAPDPFLSKQLGKLQFCKHMCKCNVLQVSSILLFLLTGWIYLSKLSHLKASMICPSWFSTSTILLIMSNRLGSFNTPVALGSTWIVKSFRKVTKFWEKKRKNPPATHSLLGWSWAVWGCHPTASSSPDPRLRLRLSGGWGWGWDWGWGWGGGSPNSFVFTWPEVEVSNFLNASWKVLFWDFLSSGFLLDTNFKT